MMALDAGCEGMPMITSTVCDRVKFRKMGRGCTEPRGREHAGLRRFGCQKLLLVTNPRALLVASLALRGGPSPLMSS